MYYSDLLGVNKSFNIEKTSYSSNVSINSSHYHAHYEILYIDHGSRVITVNETKKYKLDDHCIVLMPPNIIHSTQSASTNQTRTLINISTELMGEMIAFTSKNITACFDALILPLTDFDVKTLRYYLNLLSKHNTAQSPLRNDIIKSSLCSLLTFLSSIYYNLLSQDDTLFSKPSSSVEKVMEYISEHYYEDISLSVLAKAAALSKDHLIRIFSDKYNLTPIKFLSTFRVINAKRLLESGTMSISDVARGVALTPTHPLPVLLSKLRAKHQKNTN